MENTVISASVVIILLAPWLGRTYNMSLIENAIVRLLLVLFVFYGIRQGPMAGLLSFLASFSLLIERNHQILTKFPHQIPQWPSTAGKQGPPSYAPPLIPVSLQVSKSELGGISFQRSFAPLESSESHSYEAPHVEPSESVIEKHGQSITEHSYESAADIQDSNPRLEDIAQGEAASSFFEQKGLV